MDPVEQKHHELSGSVYRLGPLPERVPTADQAGLHVHLKRENGEKASIFWHTSTGAHVVVGGIREAWRKLDYERGFLGYPISDEEDLLNQAGITIGRVSRFQGGTIVWFRSDMSIGVYRMDGSQVAGPSHGRAAEAALQLATPTQSDARLGSMALTLRDLLEAVALQQQEIAALAEELSAVALRQVQADINQHASAHMNRAFEQARGELRGAGGEVTIGATSHEGKLKSSRKSDESEETSGKFKRDTATSVEIENKLKAALSGLGSAEAAFKLDVSRTTAILDESSRKSRSAFESSIEGSFNIKHEAIVFKLNGPV